MIRRVLIAWLVLFGWVAFRPAFAATPGYLDEALARFSADVPRGWAYTLTTTRGSATSVERFDPSRPKGGEWTLLRSQDREPTADELQRYHRYKASNPPPTSRANFAKGDLDVSTLTLAREVEAQAEYLCRFRSDSGEPLLGHVVLVLTVNKAARTIERTVLKLVSPFSPALGVRMAELELTTDYRVLPGTEVVAPHSLHSRFRGRMFFLVPIEEELRIEYSDFTRVTPAR